MVVPAAGVTTGGASLAHLDLALSLVHDHSPALAELTAGYLVVDSLPSQASYAIPAHLARTDPLVGALERHLRDRLDRPFCLADAASALGVSKRTLQRTVQRALGIPPVRFAQRIRLDHAVHLLRTTDLSVEVVAATSVTRTASRSPH